MHAELQGRYAIRGNSHTSLKGAKERLSWGRGAARAGSAGRASEARATPPGFCFYAYLFYSVCTDVWVSGRGLGGGKRRWLCRPFASQPSGPSGKEFAFSAHPDGCAPLLALALARPVRTPRLSPGTCVACRALQTNWLFPRSCGRFFLVSLVLGESPGNGHGGQVIWFCP